jgi:hypothetical protein
MSWLVVLLLAASLNAADGRGQKLDNGPPAQQASANPTANGQGQPSAVHIGVPAREPPAKAQQAKAKASDGVEWGSWPDWVIVGFTLVLTIVAILQHRLETKLGKDTGDALLVAKQSAEAALLSARVAHMALIGGARPMVLVTMTDYSPAVPSPSKPAASHPVWINLKAENCGERNAIIESFWVELAAVRQEPETPWPGTQWPAPSAERLTAIENIFAQDLVDNEVVVMPGANYPAKYETFVAMEGDDLRDMWGVGPRRLLLLTLITYRDPMGVRRERGTTFFYSPLTDYPNQWLRFETETHSFDRVVDLGDASLDPSGKGTT